MAATTTRSDSPAARELHNGASSPKPMADDSEYLTGKDLWLVMVGVLLAIFLVSLDQTIVSNALPRIASVYHALDNITWIPTAFLLTQAPFLLVFGQISTLFSLKWVFLIAVFLFEIGSLLSGVATSVGFLIGARAFQGIGAAGIFIGSISMTAEIISLKDRPKFFGLFGAVFAISGILGPVVGGAFVDHVSWRWCFYINLPLAVPTLWCCLQFLPANPSRTDRISPPKPREKGQVRATYITKRLFARLWKLDLVGCILSLGCTTCLVLALQWGGAQKPWNSADVIATLCTAAVTAVLFVAWEYYQGDAALVPLKLFKNRSQVGASLAALCNRMGFFVAIFELPLYFQAVKGHSPTMSGVDLMPVIIALVITSGVVGFLVSKTGRYWHFLILGPIIGAVGFGLIFTMDEHSSWGKIIGYQILIGVSIGTTMQTTMIAVQADTVKELIPQATGILTYSQFMGGIISLAVVGNVFQSKLVSGLHQYAPDAPVELLRKSVEVLGELSPEQRPGAIHAYVKALQWCIAPIGVVSSVFTSLCSLMVRNLNVRKEEDNPDSGKVPPAVDADTEAKAATEKAV